MRAALLSMLIVAVVVGLSVLMVLRGNGSQIEVPAPTKVEASWPDQVAANGVVEGARPEAALRPEVAGILADVHVREN